MKFLPKKVKKLKKNDVLYVLGRDLVLEDSISNGNGKHEIIVKDTKDNNKIKRFSLYSNSEVVVKE